MMMTNTSAPMTTMLVKVKRDAVEGGTVEMKDISDFLSHMLSFSSCDRVLPEA